MNGNLRHGLIILLSIIIFSCSDGGDGNSPDYFTPYLPDELPNKTHQTTTAWHSSITANTAGHITVYNALTDEYSYAEIITDEDCYDTLWLFFVVIPVEPFCLHDYSYSISVPLDVGINQLTLTTGGGAEIINREYSIERTDLVAIDEQEPNDDYYDAQPIFSPIAINGVVGNNNYYDTYVLTANESRVHTVIITGTDGYLKFYIEDYLLGLISTSEYENYFFSGSYIGARYANFELHAGEQAYITVCCSDSYLLGVY